MKRNLLAATGIAALALAMPGAALAHHGHGRHHHGAKAHAHHAKIRFVHIGATAGTPAVSPTTTTPTAPTPTPPENAGKVASYTGGVLTLTLNDGSTVSGKVTNETRIECVKATPTTPPTGSPDQSSGDDNGQGDDQSRGDMNRQGDQGQGEWRQGEDGNDGDDDGEEGAGVPEPPCDGSALVAGTVVRAAELRIGPGGTEFESVLLVR